jgi:hypothetical protein
MNKIMDLAIDNTSGILCVFHGECGDDVKQKMKTHATRNAPAEFQKIDCILQPNKRKTS